MDTSPFAYEHVLRNMRKPTASKATVGGAMGESHVPASERAFLSPLFWFYRFIIRFTVGEKIDVAQTAETNNEGQLSNFSRLNRRYIKAGKLGKLDARKILCGLYVEKLLYGGLTPAQKQEKVARISPQGRVKVYGIRYWGTRLQRQAQLVCFDHGWWRVPAVATIADGMWDVQLPDN